MNVENIVKQFAIVVQNDLNFCLRELQVFTLQLPNANIYPETFAKIVVVNAKIELLSVIKSFVDPNQPIQTIIDNLKNLQSFLQREFKDYCIANPKMDIMADAVKKIVISTKCNFVDTELKNLIEQLEVIQTDY